MASHAKNICNAYSSWNKVQKFESAKVQEQDLIWFIWRMNEKIKAIEMEDEGEGIRESIRYEWWVERNQDQGQMEKKTNGCKEQVRNYWKSKKLKKQDVNAISRT